MTLADAANRLEDNSRPQPYNNEAEQRLLGAILIDNQVYHRVARLLGCNDFGNALHCRIFANVEKLIVDGRNADPVLLKDFFDQDDALKDYGGGAYLAQLADAAAMVLYPEDYATAIHELAARREIISACEMARDDAFRINWARPAGLIIEEHTARLAHANGATTSAELPQCTKLGDWLQRDLAGPDFLLGDVLSTTSRMILIGRTGLGKTNFAMALGIAIANGDPFLHWKAGEGPRRVLFIDGEMSKRQLKQRLEDAARRAGCTPNTFHALCRDDFPNMEPLDTEAGQRFIDRFIESIGGVDLIIFDNVDALTTDDEDFGAQSWQRTLPWIRNLTRCAIGQLWLHHTGQDETRGYGSKKREWQVDIVAVMEDAEHPESDIAFKLTFKKARERNPDNRADFEPTVITLAGDKWLSEKGNISGSGKTKKPLTDLALDVLNDEIARGHGTIPLPSERIPPETPCITTGAWRKAYELRSLSGNREAAERAFYRAAKDLIEKRKLVAKHDLWVWPVR